MRPGGGRRKGAEFERWVAKQLARWWASVEPDAQFVRTPLSGGWSTPAARAGFRACGDVMTTAKRFPFAVEAKANQKIHQPSLFRDCWEQAVRQAEESEPSLLPLLVYRVNRGRAMIASWGVVLPFAEYREVIGRDGTVHLLGVALLVDLLRTDPRGWALKVSD